MPPTNSWKKTRASPSGKPLEVPIESSNDPMKQAALCHPREPRAGAAHSGLVNENFTAGTVANESAPLLFVLHHLAIAISPPRIPKKIA